MNGINAAAFCGLLAVVGGYTYYEISRRYRYTQFGKAEDRWDRSNERLHAVFTHVLGQKKVLHDPISGGLHLLIMWGFLVLGLGVVNMVVEGFFSHPLPGVGDNPAYLWIKDLFLVLVAVGVIGSLLRRTVFKPERLENSGEAFLILAFILIIVTSEALSHGAQFVAGEGVEKMAYAPVAALASKLFAGYEPEQAEKAFWFFWWLHFITMFAFAVLIPRSKHLHLLFAPLNVYWKSLEPKGALRKVDFEDESVESYGAVKMEDFTWKELFDAYTCVQCGRCTDQCPAYQTGKPLNPKALHVTLRSHIDEKGPLLDKIHKQRSAAKGVGQGRAGAEEVAAAAEGVLTEGEQAIMEKKVTGEIFSEDFFWSCTTCRGCMEACPVSNEHIPKLVEMRRYMVLTESDFPEDVQRTFNNMEKQGNPWGLPKGRRGEWAEGLGVPTLDEAPEAEYLFYVGCAGSFDDRARKVTLSLARLLQRAGLSFAILGGDEWCCGETARRMGNEYLYQEMAMTNVETWKELKVSKIITACPHCYNTIKNEYPQFGGNFDVIHHTVLLEQLVREGKLKPTKPVDMTVTFHDSCYLGRYNEIYGPPRNVLTAIGGIKVAEMPRSLEKSFCCGAGGGRMWMEEHLGSRINENRTDEALQTGAEVICSACPYCLTMLTDGCKAREAEERVQTLDLVELLERSL
ncbi:4fe-4S ferredoxin, iron-sulfur binding domain protein [Heliomicrobium modesticaldum Ice1]|uniref:4fe-4S ferredoxin, iron-sulfur binding domain protein n=1 Tax=Heliobacterium modesticaldum (strain ATCC 51547 / Ice1) TaxID=498761 RepID=B0TAM3_HELMI|nr:heterodisulfide reductase-related iron-sulfur binding cluster [Heliomicrobium modesticaldum]ABZ83675.1 4fe-4S ferredoxin, iron-sulfur binding domain protein [Heliomicrobium modesticaldum Ice1]